DRRVLALLAEEVRELDRATQISQVSTPGRIREEQPRRRSRSLHTIPPGAVGSRQLVALRVPDQIEIDDCIARRCPGLAAGERPRIVGQELRRVAAGVPGTGGHSVVDGGGRSADGLLDDVGVTVCATGTEETRKVAPTDVEGAVRLDGPGRHL